MPFQSPRFGFMLIHLPQLRGAAFAGFNRWWLVWSLVVGRRVKPGADLDGCLLFTILACRCEPYEIADPDDPFDETIIC